MKWPDELLPSQSIPFQGQPHILHVYCAEAADAYLAMQTIHVVLPYTTHVKDYAATVKLILGDWLKCQAGVQLEHTVLRYSKFMQRYPRKQTVKLTKSRWGSLGIHNDLAVNALLVMAPTWVFEYVVVHEMSHLFYRNHGPRFWQTVSRWLPEYKLAEKWLRVNGAMLMKIWF